MIRPFVDDYLAGRTPIPCALCNNHVKFDQLLVTARQIGAARIATGHYARIRFNRRIAPLRTSGAPPTSSKDQSYFLFGLTQEQMSRTDFPARRAEQASRPRNRARARVCRWPKSPRARRSASCRRETTRSSSTPIARSRGMSSARLGRRAEAEQRRTGHHFRRSPWPPQRRPSFHHWPAQGPGHRCRPPALRRADRSASRSASSLATKTNFAATPAKSATSTGSPGNAREPVEAEVKIRYRHEPAAASIEPPGPRRARRVSASRSAPSPRAKRPYSIQASKF